MSAGGKSKAPPTGRRERVLSAEEASLWEVVARAVKPLPRARTRAVAKPKAESAIIEKPVAKPARVKPAPPPPMKILARPQQKPALAPLDRRTKQKLSRGREQIDARLDLHGMRQDEAHGALSRFLRRAQADGAKFVIVVTGKGLRGGEGSERGVLRREVPRWLQMAEFRDVVVGFEVAAISHGGEGALYVRVRRGRD